MTITSSRLLTRRLIAVAAVTTLAALALPASAVTNGSVGTSPAPDIPHLATSGTDGTVEQVRQLRPCGGDMYAVGLFSSVARKAVYTRNNAFSFDEKTGAITDWDPDVNGEVNSIAFSADCSTAYLGGHFTHVNGASGPATKNIVAVSTKTGAIEPGFAHKAAGKVDTLIRVGTHLLAGGSFTTINGSSQAYLVSLNPSTGLDDHYLTLTIAGHYEYTDASGTPSAPNGTRVYNFAISPDRTRLLAMGDFTSVAGQVRRQIFMIDLGAGSGTLDAWYSHEFDRHCGVHHPFYVQDASWAPDLTKIFVATTGYKPASGPGFNTHDPRGGLCDAVAAFPASSTTGKAHHLWINYTGCDSLFSTAADANTVYFGGHERYGSNPSGCDTYLSPGATRVSAPGMGAVSQSDGRLYTTSDPTVGKYIRGRGLGADDMLVTKQGLWIASDNAQNSNGCGRTSTGAISHGHSGICLLPY
jgi:hypothetical protein